MQKTFSQRVVEAALSIPSGRVATYGDIAKACGAGGQAARSISGILGRAYQAGETNIPWHRIVYSGGKVWTSSDHYSQRMKLYNQEGILVNEQGIIENFLSVRYAF